MKITIEGKEHELRTILRKDKKEYTYTILDLEKRMKEGDNSVIKEADEFKEAFLCKLSNGTITSELLDNMSVEDYNAIIKQVEQNIHGIGDTSKN